MKNANVPGNGCLEKISEQLNRERQRLQDLVLRTLLRGERISDNPTIMTQSRRVDDLLDAYDITHTEQKQEP